MVSADPATTRLSLPPRIDRAMGTAGELLQGDRFTVRQKTFAIGNKYVVHDHADRPVAYAKQKMLRLKEGFHITADEKLKDPILTFEADRVFDLNSVFRVIDAKQGDDVGYVGRSGLRSLVQDHWTLYDADRNKVADIEEDSLIAALVRRFIVAVPQTHVFRADGTDLGRYTRRFSLRDHYDLDLSSDTEGRIDRRLAVATGILLDAMEDR